MSARAEAVEKFSMAILEIVAQADKNAPKEFEKAAEEALATLTKEEVIQILMFLIVDHEIFFDIFDQSTSRNKTFLKIV